MEAEGGQGAGILGEEAAGLLPTSYGGLRERCKLLQQGPGPSPGRKRIFWHEKKP